MRFSHHIAFSRFSLQPTMYSLLAVSAVLLMFAAARNPVAVALPIAGTLAATAMVWSIDRVQSRVQNEASNDL